MKQPAGEASWQAAEGSGVQRASCFGTSISVSSHLGRFPKILTLYEKTKNKQPNVFTAARLSIITISLQLTGVGGQSRLALGFIQPALSYPTMIIPLHLL